MKKQNIIKIVIAIFVLAVLGVGIYVALKAFGVTDIVGIRMLVEKCGVWGWLVFMALFIAVSVLLCFIPGTSATFIVVAVICFGAIKAFILCAISVILASSLMFLIGNTLGEKTATKLVGAESLHKAQELIDVKSKIFLPLMFLFPVFPDDALCICAGMTKMKYWYFLIVVAIFRTIGIATICFLGSGFINWAELSIIDWFVLVNICIFDIYAVFKISGKIENKIKEKKVKKDE